MRLQDLIKQALAAVAGPQGHAPIPNLSRDPQFEDLVRPR